MVVGLGKLQRLVWEGGANLRGLIMTPYHSLQELPSIRPSHHTHGMTWKQEMHVIFDTAWLLLAAGETSTWISCCSTCLFQEGRKECQES